MLCFVRVRDLRGQPETSTIRLQRPRPRAVTRRGAGFPGEDIITLTTKSKSINMQSTLTHDRMSSDSVMLRTCETPHTTNNQAPTRKAPPPPGWSKESCRSSRSASSNLPCNVPAIQHRLCVLYSVGPQAQQRQGRLWSDRLGWVLGHPVGGFRLLFCRDAHSHGARGHHPQDGPAP